MNKILWGIDTIALEIKEPLTQIHESLTFRKSIQALNWLNVLMNPL